MRFIIYSNHAHCTFLEPRERTRSTCACVGEVFSTSYTKPCQEIGENNEKAKWTWPSCSVVVDKRSATHFECRPNIRVLQFYTAEINGIFLFFIFPNLFEPIWIVKCGDHSLEPQNLEKVAHRPNLNQALSRPLTLRRGRGKRNGMQFAAAALVVAIARAS